MFAATKITDGDGEVVVMNRLGEAAEDNLGGSHIACNSCKSYSRNSSNTDGGNKIVSTGDVSD